MPQNCPYRQVCIQVGRFFVVASKKVVENEENALLEEIVRTNQLKILGRLRSRHASRSSLGPAPIGSLQKALEKVNTGLFGSQRLHDLQTVAKKLSTSFKTLEKLTELCARSTIGCCIVVDIIREIHSNLDFEELIACLSTIPPQDSPWADSPCDRVVRKFKKLSQYVSAAKHLRYIVKRYPKWEIREVCNDLYKERADGASADDATGFFTQSLNTGTTKERRVFRRNLEAILDTKIPQIQNEIKHNSKRKKRVHAEIQILYHYEQNPNGNIPPRVICSNKEACYLCNRFFKAHGRFLTPRCHGNFYQKWRLPQFDELQLSKASKHSMNLVISQFNQDIKNQLEQYIALKPRIHHDPSESTVFLSGIYSPSVMSTAPTMEAIREDLISLVGPGSTSIAQWEQDSDSKPSPSVLVVPILSGKSQSIHAKHDTSMHTSPITSSKSGISGSHAFFPGSVSTSAESLVLSDSSGVDSMEANGGHMANCEHTVQSNVCQTYWLSYGLETVIRVSRGSPIRFHTQGVHCEFIYEANSDTNRIATNEDPVDLQIEWLREDHERLADDKTPCLRLEQLPDTDEVSCAGIFAKRGLVIEGKNCKIRIRAGLV
jgi:hypothetical protein